MNLRIFSVFCCCILFFACRKECHSPAVPVTKLWEAVPDTCFNVGCISISGNCPAKFTQRRLVIYSFYDPVDVNVIYLLCNDSVNAGTTTTWFNKSLLRMDLRTGDTSSFKLNLFTGMGMDENHWFYYMNSYGHLVKSKSDGSLYKDMGLPPTVTGVPKFIYVGSKGTELMLHTYGDSLLFLDNNGNFESLLAQSDFCRNAEFMGISPDFTLLLFKPRSSIDTLYMVNRFTKEIVNRIYASNSPTLSYGNIKISAANDKILTNNFEDLAVIDIQNKGSRVLRQRCLNRRYSNYDFSPDGSKIISSYISNLSHVPLSDEIYVAFYASIMNFDGSDEKRLLLD